MAKFKGAILDCVICGAKFKVPPSRADKAKACSPECGNKLRGISNSKEKVKFNCAHCEKAVFTHEAHAGRRVFCSRGCQAKSGSQLGKRQGAENQAWKGGRTLQSDGYSYIRATDHPLQKTGYVFEHRLVMEKWLLENEPNSPYLVQLDAGKFLDPTIVVHHKDENKTHNSIENLECMTSGDHAKHHRGTGNSF